MARGLSQLSIAQIRERYVRGGEPLTTAVLGQLQRDPRRGVRALHALLSRRHERERQERLRLDAMLNFERVLWRSGLRRVAGVDEAGTGPLAGPVVAAAVVFPPDTQLRGVDDSKRLDPARREELAESIRKCASGLAVGVAEVEEIDRLNVYQAALLAMRRAVEALPEPAEHVLVDARTIPGIPQPQNAFEKGDGIDFSIAAASIIAKTHRDGRMRELDARYPGYGFAQHKGYATADHQEAIRRLGLCPIHRRSFAFLRELRGEYSERFYALQAELAGLDAPDLLRSFEERLEAECAALGPEEQRKLRLSVGRRWKALPRLG